MANACFAELFLKFYFSISLCVMVVSLLTAVMIVHISLQGTLINAYPRRHMPKFLVAKVICCTFVYLILIVHLCCQFLFILPIFPQIPTMDHYTGVIPLEHFVGRHAPTRTEMVTANDRVLTSVPQHSMDQQQQ